MKKKTTNIKIIRLVLELVTLLITLYGSERSRFTLYLQ